MKWFALLLKEAIAAAHAQRTSSFLTIAMCFAMVAAVMMTTGRTVGAEEAVLASIESAGTRTVTIRSQAEPALTSGDLERLANLEGIEWLAGFSRAYDTVNSHFTDGQRVPIRYLYGPAQTDLGIRPSPSPHISLAYASTAASTALGLHGPGPIQRLDGLSYDVSGTVTVPDFLEDLEPLLLVPGDEAQPTEPVTTIKFVVTEANLVKPVTSAVVALLAVEDSNQLTVEMSAQLTEISKLVERQLGDFSRELVLLIFSVTAIILAIILHGLVMMRRKDFGRRRALGATRSTVVSLLVTQTGVLAVTGVTLGALTSIAALRILGDPIPHTRFTIALCILGITAALTASLIPAVAASRRDPIKELRVP
ncbi:FtsX-like permease family protein [Timonella senegalensis]|uniref:FtsX-like permease family protein n=1 Tax=Timonella senegalensis TaxID=1465825 RepID=UPI0028A59472|nr:FtsX-like permease family protein [Timonella senegalensis]